MTPSAPVRTPLGVLPLADGTYAVASSDPSHAPYLIEPEGATFTCTCPAWKYAPDDGDVKRCKHTDSVRAHLARQYAEQVRQQPRWCSVCMMNPVVDTFPICASCMEDEQRRLAAANARTLALLGWEG